MSITKKEPRTEWYGTGGKQDNVPPGLDISGGLDGAQFQTNDQISVYWRDAADTGLFGELTRQNVANGTKVDAVSPVITNNNYVLAYYNETAAEYQVTGILDTDPKAEYVVFNKNVTDSWTIGTYTGAVDVAIFRTTELTQDHEYRDGDKYYATNNENVADKAMSAIQELDYDRDRSLKFDPAYEPNNPNDTTLPRPEADQFIKWNATGDALENAPSHTVRVTPNDTTPKTLREKIVDSASVQWNEINDGGDETLEAFAVNGAIDHDQLFNFELDEHVAHSDVNIIAGSSLTGGGNIASDVTLNVDQAALNHDLITGTGGLNHEDISIVAGDGLTGGGSIDAASVPLHVDPSGALDKPIANDTDEILLDDGAVQKTTLFPSTTVAPDSANDELLFRDATDGTLRKNTIATILGGATNDGFAIHDNVENEIQVIASKTTPVAADEFLIEDSADATPFAKKSLSFGDLQDTMQYRVSSNDTTPGRLEDKVVAGLNITVNTLNDGANETLEIVGTAGYTDEQAQDAVGGILTDTATVDFTYNDAGDQITADVVDDSIDNTKAANMPANTIKGNNTGAAADPIDLTGTEVTAMLDVVTAADEGLVPILSGTATEYLDGSGNWSTPAGGGGGPSIDIHEEDDAAPGKVNTADTTKITFKGGSITATEPTTAGEVEVSVTPDGTRFQPPVHFKMGGLLTSPADVLDSPAFVPANRSLTKVRITARDSGASGSSTIRINKGTGATTTGSISVTFNHGNGPVSQTFEAPTDFNIMSLGAGDYLWPDATAVGAGGFEDLGISVEFGDEKINAAPAHFALHGPVTIPLTRFGAPWNVNGDRTVETIRVSAFDAGTAGTTTVRIHKDGPSGASSVDATLDFDSVNGSLYTKSTTVSMQLEAGDVMWAELLSVATGGVEDLGVDVYWGSENLLLTQSHPVPPASDFKLNGILNTAVDRFDAFRIMNGPRNMRAIRCVAFDSGTSGSTTIRINRGGPSGSAQADIVLPANGGINSAAQTAVDMNLEPGDYIWPSIPSIASGGIEDLTVECFYGSEALMSSMTIAGRTITDMENFVMLKAGMNSGTAAGRYAPFIASNETSGYQVPAGKQLRIVGHTLIRGATNGAIYGFGYGDPGFGISTTQPTNAVYEYNKTGAGPELENGSYSNDGPLSISLEIASDFIVIAGKTPFVKLQAPDAGTVSEFSVTIYAVLEDV